VVPKDGTFIVNVSLSPLLPIPPFFLSPVSVLYSISSKIETQLLREIQYPDSRCQLKVVQTDAIDSNYRKPWPNR